MALLSLQKFIGAVAYPPGSIYCTTNNINPAEIWGGSWERFAQGRTLIGVNEEDEDFASAELEMGEKTHNLTTDEMPSHTHSENGAGSHYHWIPNCSGSGSAGVRLESYASGNAADRGCYTDTAPNHTHTINATGGGGAHNNIQPSVTVYFWRRLTLFPSES